MYKRVIVLAMCLGIARAAAADPLVSWESTGVIEVSQYIGMTGTPLTPPVGTPYTMTLSFNPSAATPTIGSLPGSGCVTVPASGSLSIGGTNFSLSGSGSTHAQLPGNPCAPGWLETQFVLGIGTGDSPWIIDDEFGFAELSYADLLVQDAFPADPTPYPGTGMRLQIRDFSNIFLVVGDGDLQAAEIEQPAAVPEPATLTLFSAGLAAIIRRSRRA